MSVRARGLLIGAWAVSVLGTGAWAGAQGRRWTPLTAPTIVAGSDVGFRVEWMDGRVPTGTLVIRVNGAWIEARLGGPPDRQAVPPAPDPNPPPPPR